MVFIPRIWSQHCNFRFVSPSVVVSDWENTQKCFENHFFHSFSLQLYSKKKVVFSLSLTLTAKPVQKELVFYLSLAFTAHVLIKSELLTSQKSQFLFNLIQFLVFFLYVFVTGIKKLSRHEILIEMSRLNSTRIFETENSWLKKQLKYFCSIHFWTLYKRKILFHKSYLKKKIRNVLEFWKLTYLYVKIF